MIGWVLLSRDQVTRAEAALRPDNQGVLDEVGLLALHQAFADRFFPGTSVLHTRLRYALFVPWAMADAQGDPDRLRKYEIRITKQLARRWDPTFKRPGGIIGVDSLPEGPSQPPSVSYWGALSRWGILRQDIASRSRVAVLRLLKIRASQQRELHRADGELLATPEPSPFVDLPQPPKHWLVEGQPLDFHLLPEERQFVRRHWIGLQQGNSDGRPGLSLLAQLAAAPAAKLRPLLEDSDIRPWHPAIAELVDVDDRRVLQLAKRTAAMACIARAIYAALVERERGRDGLPKGTEHHTNLQEACTLHRADASGLNLEELRQTLTMLPADLFDLLKKTQQWLRIGKSDLEPLWDDYRFAEERKKRGRARLPRTRLGRRRRGEWKSEEHPLPEMLHYRWGNVRQLLLDLKEPVA